MARKRMFDNEVINQDDFLDLPKEAIALYFLLGMNADDEGFLSPKKVLRLFNIAEDNLKVLIAKKFVIPFESGVVVITDWKRNNYLDKNKVSPTIYQDEKQMLTYNPQTQKYQWLNQSLTEVKLEFNKSLASIVENSIEKNSIVECSCSKNENQILKCYEENIGLLTPASAQLIYSYLDTFTEDIICEAIKKASIVNIRNTKYICGILNDWKSKNIKTLVDIDEEEKKYRSKQKKDIVETEEEKMQRQIKMLEEEFGSGN